MNTLMPGPCTDSPQRTRRTQRTQRTQRNALGVTLIELLVVLLLLGIMTGVSGLALHALRAPERSRWAAVAAHARRAAIVTGHPVVARDSTDSTTTEHAALFLPDGRAIGWGVDPLTGEVTNETR
jgi:prepilin-type N-terminal cleavage/methylation domain-containing protein